MKISGICLLYTSSKSELSDYFTPLGDADTLDKIYNFIPEKSYGGEVYGIANGGTAGGIVYNKKVWADAGISELPATPDEFLEDLQTIKDKTDAVQMCIRGSHWLWTHRTGNRKNSPGIGDACAGI